MAVNFTINGKIVISADDREEWINHLKFLQKACFNAIQYIGEKGCQDLEAIVSRKLIKAFDNDFDIKREIAKCMVRDVMDGLKIRPRNGHETACSLFKISFDDYKALVSLCTMYENLESALSNVDNLDIYQMVALANTADNLITCYLLEDQKLLPIKEDEIEHIKI